MSAAEYTETEVSEGDTRSDILETLAGGAPWIFIQVIDIPESPTGFNLKLDVGGGISKSETVRALLKKTLEALP